MSISLRPLFGRRSGTIDRAAPSNADGARTRPEDFHAVAHPLVTAAPDLALLVSMVETEVDRLAARGSLDAGTGDALDYWIDDMRHGWQIHVEQHAAIRKSTAAALRQQARRNLESSMVQLSFARQRHLETTESRAYWRDVLLGVPVGPPLGSTRSTDEQVTNRPDRPTLAAEPDLDFSDLAPQVGDQR